MDSALNGTALLMGSRLNPNEMAIKYFQTGEAGWARRK
jgi:hypothetical protein